MATNTPAAETPKTDPPADRCANCDAELAGEYCTRCGQKKIHRHEFAVKSFVRHLVNEITDLESNKIFRTFSALLFKPGLLTAEYLAGRKKLHIGPVRLYLTLSAIYFLFAWGTLAGVRGGGANRIVEIPNWWPGRNGEQLPRKPWPRGFMKGPRSIRPYYDSPVSWFQDCFCLCCISGQRDTTLSI